MIRTTRSGALAHPSRARPRSGTIRVHRHPTPPTERAVARSAPLRTAEATSPGTTSGGRARSPDSEQALVICGIVGLVLFPIAGAAVLGRVVSPVVFVFAATVAIALFYRSLLKLDPADR